jgi:hypothetical protein
MSNAIAERAAAIRQHRHLRDHPDQSLVRRYSFVGARFEELRLRQHDGKTTPADDDRLSEIGRMLDAMTKKLNLGPGFNGFLPKDPQRLIYDSWLEAARMWFQ